MKKRGSLYEKILKQTTRLPVLTLIIIVVIVALGLFTINANITSISSHLGQLSASSSKVALEEQVKDQLVSLAKSKAALSDEKLRVIQDNVKLIAKDTEYVLANSHKYGATPVPEPKLKNKGKFVLQLKYAEGLTYADVQDDVELLGNVSSILDITKTSSTITKTYIGGESGYFITADDYSDEEPKYLDPRTRPWYIEAKETGDLIWTDVYDDVYGKGLAITCAAPYYYANGEFAGVAGIGWLMNDLVEIIVGTQIGESGSAFVLNENGEVIISPNLTKDEKGNIQRENLLESDNEELKNIAKAMQEGKSGLENVTIDGKVYCLAYEPFEVMPWSIATMVPLEEVVAPALEAETTINTYTKDAVTDISMIMIIIFAALIATTCVMFLYIKRATVKTASSISQPILDLTEGAEIIGGGDLSHKLKVETGDEIETLANTFNLMIDNIKDITSEKERIGAELNVAKQIQASMLPCIFPPFPDKKDSFDIYALMRPAKEVGGDFYDFFMIDEKHIGVVIADVSDKGVPAALFMVIAKTLIKNQAQMGKPAEDVLKAVNEQLCENNDSMLFVTCFMGILDLDTGNFTYVNAGHNPPLWKKNNGEYEWMEVNTDCVLAIMEGIKYRPLTITMGKGDRIYMYTDGVTDAINTREEQFAEERLKDTINSIGDLELDKVLYHIRDTVDEFSGEEPQFDDMTMLIFEYKGMN